MKTKQSAKIKQSKIKVAKYINFRAYHIIGNAVDRGIDAGWKHAHKHADHPKADTIASAIYDDIMLALDEVLDFDSGIPD